jgi:oligoendopeptidase F
MNDSPLQDRRSVDPALTWDAAGVFADRAAWRAECAALGGLIPPLASAAGSLGAADGDAARLLAFLERSEALAKRLGILNFYAYMSQAVDVHDAEAQAMVGQAGALLGSYQAAVSFLEPELLAIGRPRLDAWMAASPGLAGHRHGFDNLFRKQAHVRSAEVEEALGLVSEVFQSADNIHEMLVNADLRFQPASGGAAVAQSTIENHLGSPDRELRRTAWENYCDAHLAMGNTLAATLGTAVKRDVFNARMRRFDSSLDAALFADNIPRAVYDTTIATFRKNQGVWKRYWRVRKRALGLDRLAHYDIWAPLSKNPPVVPFAQAVDWICAAMEPLGSDYVATLRAGCLQKRWVDACPTAGKSAGAFSYGHPGTEPFIMMSYANDLSSLSTLTHELGHSMHSWHTWRHQPYAYSDYSMFVAEVASNFHQAMTRAWLFEHCTDRDFQIALIDEAMENFHRYFFIMPTLARFELEFHQRVERGEGLGAGELNGLMADLFAEGYGGELEIDRAREGSTWAQFGHLYANFYVFQYATGISAAHALAGPILAGDRAAAGRYRDFLSCGSSRYPVDALRLAGVDMGDATAMERGFAVLDGLVDRLEELFPS